MLCGASPPKAWKAGEEMGQRKVGKKKKVNKHERFIFSVRIKII